MQRISAAPRLTPDVQALALFALNCAAVFMVSAVLGPLGPVPVGLPFLAVPVAIYATTGKPRFCAGLIASAAAGTVCTELAVSAIFGAAPVWASPWNAGLNACMAATGIILAAGISRCWSYGKLAIAVAAPVVATQTVNMAIRWEALQAWFAESLDTIRAELQAPLAQPPDEVQRALLQQWQWLSEHWSAWTVGYLFAIAMIGACVAISFTSLWLRRVVQRPGPVGGFRTFCVPDWLAWAVIAAAVMAYVDYRWPSAPIRIVAWNLGVALIITYWLNGLAILAYGIYVANAINARFAGYLMAGATLLLFQQALVPLGLFDTWFGFRKKLDKLIEAKRLLDQSRHDDE